MPLPVIMRACSLYITFSPAIVQQLYDISVKCRINHCAFSTFSTEIAPLPDWTLHLAR
jgi:hypothetical protein